jgi:hypothetical protein
MALYFVICETEDKKFINRVYDNSEECRQYFASLIREVQSKPERYHVLRQTDTELTIEELGEKGARVQSKYTCLTGEIADMDGLVQEPKDEDTSSLL